MPSESRTYVAAHARRLLIHQPYALHFSHGSAPFVGWGLGAGCIIAAFWNYMNLFVSDFIATGLRELSLLLTAGELRPGQIAVVAATGHFLLIAGCLALFLRLRPGLKRWGQFFAGGVLAVGYLVLSVFTTGPQFVGILRRVFGI